MPEVRKLNPDEEVLPTPQTVRPLAEGEDVMPAFPPGTEASQGLNPIEAFGRGSNVSIAETLGGPVDLANIVLSFVGLESEEPPLGSASIQRAFSALGIAPAPGEEDPDTLAGSIGRVTGAAASVLLPIGAAGRAATTVDLGRKVAPTGIFSNIVQDIGRSAVATPGRFLAAETAGAVGAGVGGFAARERFPDSEAASFIGEFTGGLTPAGVVGVAKTLPTVLGIRFARSLTRPFTTSGSRRRAERRVQEVARDATGAAQELGEQVPDVELTPAQQTGDEGLLSLERSVIESSEQLKGESDEQIARATAAIRGELEGLGEGVSPEKTAEALEEARGYLLDLMDTRVRIASQKADERIAALGPEATREEANLIARQELEGALRAARAQERELWTAVPREVEVSTVNSREAFEDILADTPRAQRDDISETARRFLEAGSNERVGDLETVAELQGLRSKLLEESRAARAAGKFNDARIAETLADAVLADMGAVRGEVAGEAGESLRAALDFSADLNGKFTRGPVGRLLGSDRTGGARVPDQLTLDTTVGKGGPRAKVETEALLEATQESQRTPALRGAIEDFLLDDFQRRAVKNGQIDSRAAQGFLARHQDVLDDFPELGTRFVNAIEANDAAALAAKRAEGLAKRLNDPKISRAAIFLKGPVDQAIERVAKSPNPGEAMREIVRQAGRDTTGDATKGIKTAFGDFLLKQASTRKATVDGDFIVSGSALKRILKDGRTASMARELFSPEELKRLDEITSVAAKLEKAVSAKGRPEGIIADTPAFFLSVAARVMGAQVGRKIAIATGGGTVQTPGILSGTFQKALNSLTTDKARRLLIDAVGDEDLFKALLLKGDTPADAKVIRKQLNAWLLSVGEEQITEDEE